MHISPVSLDTVPISVLHLILQSYIQSSDKQFVASAIQAIGRCASNISEVTDTCLAGLVRLLSNRDGEYSHRNAWVRMKHGCA